VISILSIGVSRPPNVLDDTITGKEQQQAVYSTLNLDYLKETANKDAVKAIHNTVISTTELGTAAALAALDKVGLSKDEVGLVLADCATPLELIPGESQRIACALSLKIPAYDIVSGSNAFHTFLQTLKSWKEDKLPEYILCISTNSPTQRINYSQGKERSAFSDGAGAALISTRKRGKLILNETTDFIPDMDKGAMQIDLFGHLKVDFERAEKNYGVYLNDMRQFLKEKKISPLIFMDSFPGQAQTEGALSPRQANSLGAGLFFALEENWEKLKKNDIILLLSSALEMQGGGISLLTVEN
jgi:hypothetical protein